MCFHSSNYYVTEEKWKKKCEKSEGVIHCHKFWFKFHVIHTTNNQNHCYILYTRLCVSQLTYTLICNIVHVLLMKLFNTSKSKTTKSRNEKMTTHKALWIKKNALEQFSSMRKKTACSHISFVLVRFVVVLMNTIVTLWVYLFFFFFRCKMCMRWISYVTG